MWKSCQDSAGFLEEWEVISLHTRRQCDGNMSVTTTAPPQVFWDKNAHAWVWREILCLSPGLYGNLGLSELQKSGISFYVGFSDTRKETFFDFCITLSNNISNMARKFLFYGTKFVDNVDFILLFPIEGFTAELIKHLAMYISSTCYLWVQIYYFFYVQYSEKIS